MSFLFWEYGTKFLKYCSDIRGKNYIKNIMILLSPFCNINRELKILIFKENCLLEDQVLLIHNETYNKNYNLSL